MTINNMSISQLKINPTKAINSATDYPLAITSKNKIKAYLVGKDFNEKMLLCIEEYIDVEVVKGADAKRSNDFEKVAEELDI